MTLTVGARLGPYEIRSSIGAGGMGEVFRARDIRLKRDVALKVLPESFASDPDRLARFTREAHVLASLNHPNIGAIYGFEDSGDVHALVLELVEGPTLADRIARGPIPVDEALAIARQIAEALEAAHELLVGHEVRVQHLDGHGLAERQLLGAIDVPHRALTDEALDAEVARDEAARQRIEVVGRRAIFLWRLHDGRRRAA